MILFVSNTKIRQVSYLYLCLCLWRNCESVSHSVVSNSLWRHGLQQARLLCPWSSPGKHTGVGCHSFLQGIFPTQGSNLPYCRQIFFFFFLPSELPGNLCHCSVVQSCPTLCNPIDCSTPGFSVFHHLQEFAQTHVHWVSDVSQPSHCLLPPSPALNLSQHQGLFQMSQLFASSCQIIGASISASVLPVNI